MTIFLFYRIALFRTRENIKYVFGTAVMVSHLRPLIYVKLTSVTKQNDHTEARLSNDRKYNSTVSNTIAENQERNETKTKATYVYHFYKVLFFILFIMLFLTYCFIMYCTRF